jgi:outer membrane protein OmpA-like peptidoglycan-associated protein
MLFDLIHGEVDNENVTAGGRVELIDSDGNLLDYTYVNEEGRFTFASVKGLENYTISFGEEVLSEGDKVTLYDKNFGKLEVLEVDENGEARFELLTPEDYVLEKQSNTDDSMLSVDISGMLASASGETDKGVEIFLQDSEGNTIARAYTNEDGQFTFEKVKPDESYSFQSAVVDPDSEIRIFNQNGDVIETVKPDESGDFVYIRLKETDKIITITNEQEVQVKVGEDEIFNLPVIYFELDRTKLTEESIPVLGQLVSILKENPHVRIKLSGHTDSKGDAEYNLRLSRDRVGSVKNYLLEQGLNEDRITGEGFGEQMLVNKCRDGVECSDEEHAENRRIEIQFISMQ